MFVDDCKSPEVSDDLGADGLIGVLDGLVDFLAKFMTDKLVDVVVGDHFGCEVAGGCAFVEVFEAEFDDEFAMTEDSLVPDYPQCVWYGCPHWIVDVLIWTDAIIHDLWVQF